uniref:Saposin B-type domain-containing protein n=1 Tax=Panagrellus redivivus TaxID=6233 RepID=A0A7E4W1K3_PANRE
MKLNLISAVALFMVISFALSEDDDDCTRCERYVQAIGAWNAKNSKTEVHMSEFEHTALAVKVGCQAIYREKEKVDFCEKAEMTNWKQLKNLIYDKEWIKANDRIVCRKKLAYC